MYYEINVSKNGHHVFATAERSLTTITATHVLYKLFKEKFPPEEGYLIEVTEWEKRGQEIKMEAL